MCSSRPDVSFYHALDISSEHKSSNTINYHIIKKTRQHFRYHIYRKYNSQNDNEIVISNKRTFLTFITKITPTDTKK